MVTCRCLFVGCWFYAVFVTLLSLCLRGACSWFAGLGVVCIRMRTAVWFGVVMDRCLVMFVLLCFGCWLLL